MDMVFKKEMTRKEFETMMVEILTGDVCLDLEPKMFWGWEDWYHYWPDFRESTIIYAFVTEWMINEIDYLKKEGFVREF